MAFPSFYLGPERYRISVAVWDKMETLAYDYHNACYPLTISGVVGNDALARLPFSRGLEGISSLASLCFMRNKPAKDVTVDILSKDIDTGKITIDAINFSSRIPPRDGAFFTNDSVSCVIKLSCAKQELHYTWLWLGIYRSDGILCQKIFIPVAGGSIRFKFPLFAFLPGSYRVALGLWQAEKNNFVLLKHHALVFRTVFDKPDHGTIYIPHSWNYSKGH